MISSKIQMLMPFWRILYQLKFYHSQHFGTYPTLGGDLFFPHRKLENGGSRHTDIPDMRFVFFGLEVAMLQELFPKRNGTRHAPSEVEGMIRYV